MRSNVFGLGIALGAFAVIGWAFHDHPVIARPLASIKNAVASAGPAVRAAVPGGTPAAGTRKCVAAGQVTYTNQACPPGSQAEALGGHVTVLPAAQAAPTPAPPPAPPSASELREQAVQRALNR